MNIITELINATLQDEYFYELLNKIELNYSKVLFEKDGIVELTEKEFLHILRFMDILSYSESREAVNLTYSILSSLHIFYSNNSDYKVYANTVLIRLGNFPSLEIINNNKGDEFAIFETKIEGRVKKELFKTPDSKNIFTSSQYKVFKRLKDSNHFSLSAPTSFGKSFLIDTFINYIIEERQGVDNIAILVPTRALINQVSKRLKKILSGDNINKYKVLTHPKVPKNINNIESKYIFVLTPERLISYFGDEDNPKLQYIFVDEAHKIIKNKDSRAPVYYHSISMANSRSIKLYFSSPNIGNPEIFLKIFNKNIDQSIAITDSPVSQYRYFIDLVDKKGYIFLNSKRIAKDNSLAEFDSLYELLETCGHDTQNIIYCNSIKDTITYALNFADKLPVRANEKIDSLINLVKEYVHEDYYLIDCLKKGIGFHFGRLPQRIRERVERLFVEGHLDYMFCTSTLLEGVNLPAKNIFILNNRIGMSKFEHIDFWNLAGRAGRLNKELAGNIICIRLDENKWENEDYKILEKNTLVNVEPVLEKGKKNFYKNLDNIINEKKLTRKNVSENERQFLTNFSNIVFTHTISEYNSYVLSSFMKENKIDAKETINKIYRDNKVDPKILEQSITIKPKYQNILYSKMINKGIQEIYVPEKVTLESCNRLLEELHSHYNWELEESRGNNPMIKDKEQLKYFSLLMYSWMTNKPLKYMIINVIDYYSKKGSIWHKNTRKYFKFDKSNKYLINYIINELIADIDNILRFKIKNYVSNYFLLIENTNEKSMDKNNWSEYLEYGTNRKDIMSLQDFGIPRYLAIFIIEANLLGLSKNEDGYIYEIDSEVLLESIDKIKYKEEYEDLLQYIY